MEMTHKDLPDQIKTLLKIQNIDADHVVGVVADCAAAKIMVTTERHDRPFQYVKSQWMALTIKKKKK